jgi:simple sugar transport system permease protein
VKERLPILITAAVLVLTTVAAGLHFDNFLTLRVVGNLLSDNAFLAVVAVGSTFVILTGGIDLSVGSMVGLASIVAAYLIQQAHWSAGFAIGCALAIGATVGFGQGWLIAKYGLPPFLVTLAGLFLCRGAALAVSRESIQIGDVFFGSLSSWSLPLPGKASLTVPSVALLAVVLFGMWLAKQTKFGRSVYAIGGNPASATLMGLPVRRTLIFTYVLSGVSAALGGVLFAVYTSSGNAISGTGLELDAIAAVVIGGTLLSGGYGSVFGTFLGIGILGVVQTAITFQGTLSSWWTKIVIGALLLAFLLIQKGIETAARRSRTVNNS